ncbi:MAG: hypothetical protein ABTQ34_02300 [Bdellovibrionales bacterium]
MTCMNTGFPIRRNSNHALASLLREANRLRVTAPQPLPADLVERVRLSKPNIIHALLHKQDKQPAFNHEAFDERAAIIQANGVPKLWAEGFATHCTMQCPESYWPERWQQIVDDGGRFLDRWGRQATKLGWQALDVFGVNPSGPRTAL